MIREALDHPTMYNKQNTTVKTTLQPVVTPVGFVSITLTKVSFQALKFLDKLSKSKDYVSYSQNLGEVCADYTCSLYKLRLKFVQTSAEVSRKYYVLTNLCTRTY